MEYVWLGVLLISLLVLLFYVPKIENMTNKDLLATLDKFGKTGTKSKSSADTYQEEIYGPKVPKTEEPAPASSGGKSTDGSNVYPDIYGPEITPVPGMKKSKSKKGSHTSDAVEDDSYEFNPDFRKAFPVEEDEPQPFLTDFSKFQH